MLNFRLPVGVSQESVRSQLNKVAAQLGYTAKAGPAGSGGAISMLLDIANGTLEVRNVARTVTVEMTAERLRAMDDNGMQLYATPGSSEPYWNHTASFMDDACIATVQDFLDDAGYDDLDGVDDDELFSLDVELLPQRK